MSYITLYLADSRQFLVPVPGSRDLSCVVYGSLYRVKYMSGSRSKRKISDRHKLVHINLIITKQKIKIDKKNVTLSHVTD